MIVRVGMAAVELLDDDRICLGIKAKGTFEPNTLQLWSEICRDGGTVIDVGAYSGLFSIAAEKLGAHAIAVEPLPEMQKRFLRNCANNGVSPRLIKAAACNSDREVRLGFNHLVPLTSGASLSRKSGGSLMVKALRLDKLMSDVPIKAIKIDVERCEIDTLKGAMKLLKKDRPKLIVETLEQEAAEAVTVLLKDLYHPVHLLDNRNLILEPRE